MTPVQQQPAKSWPARHKILSALIALATIVAAIAISNVKDPGGVAPAGSSSGSTITFAVTSTGGTIGDVDWGVGGGSQQNTAPGNPWQVTDDLNGNDPSFASLVAQNGAAGDISCTISTDDGTVIATNTSSGPYAVVTCSP